MLPQPGSGFGRYDIERRLGRGGMGVVYAAVHRDLDRRVALKILSPELAESDEYRHRFLREAQVLARLDSPSIVRVYDAGEQDGWLYIATELIEGGDLKELLATYGPMPPELAVSIVAQAAAGLVTAHARGVLHRDIKPSNVLVERRSDGSYRAILCDLGISAVIGSEHTKTTGVVGTLGYMAPERHEGRDATESSDVYALGCLLWACLTGHPPYTGPDVQVALGHLNGEIPQLAGSGPVTDAINDFLRTSLTKNPARRYPSARAAEEALAAIVPGATAPDPDATVLPALPTVIAETTPVEGRTPTVPDMPPPEPAELAARTHLRPPPALGRTPVSPPPTTPPPTTPPPAPAAPPHRPRRRLVAAVTAAVVVVAALATGGWAYGTGRLGFGPLSADDRSAIAAVEMSPRLANWKDSEKSCAAQDFVHHHRAKSLIKDGFLSHEGGTWKVMTKPPADDVADLESAVFACSPDWASHVATSWHVSPDTCIVRIGPAKMASFLARGDKGTGARLDDCYGPKELAPPSVTATSGERSVNYHVKKVLPVRNATASIQMHLHGQWLSVGGGVYPLPTKVGGARSCATFRTVAREGWASAPLVSPVTKVCGRADPPKIWWTKAARCTSSPGCASWGVHASGLRADRIYAVVYRQDGGSCGYPKSCRVTLSTDGTGELVGAGDWSFPADYDATFTATVGKLTAAVPF